MLDLSTEAEEQPLLKTATKKRLVRTLQARKNLACAVVISKMWKSVIVL
jgi:hypothetical protein